MNELKNSCRFIGNVGNVSFSYLPSGMQLVEFGIAVNMRKKSGDEYVNETMWVDVKGYGNIAERVHQYLNKGTYALLDCQYVKRPFQDKEGNKRVAHEFHLRDFEILRSSQANVSEEAEYLDDVDLDTVDEIPF